RAILARARAHRRRGIRLVAPDGAAGGRNPRAHPLAFPRRPAALCDRGPDARPPERRATRPDARPRAHDVLNLARASNLVFIVLVACALLLLAGRAAVTVRDAELSDFRCFYEAGRLVRIGL